MSEVPRNTIAHTKQNEFGPNYLGYCKHLVLELFSQNEDVILPFLGLDSEVSVATCSGGEAEGTHNHDMGRKVKYCSGSGSYFTGGVGQGLSEFKKEKLKAILNESAACLNQEADEILDQILATFQIDSDRREKELLPCYSSASDEDLSMPLHSKKRKASSPSSNNSGNNINSIRQVYNDIQALQGKGEICHEAVEKYSVELLAKLGKMEEDLEEFLNIVVSKCRLMTRAEKHQLGKKIQKLPQKALDRVVEIIQHSNFSARNLPESISVNLEEQDNVTLWRLYHYVELVVKANKL